MPLAPLHARRAVAAVAAGLTVAAAPMALHVLLEPASATTTAKDTDGDGMPDRWEVRHGLNPYRANGKGDPDHDGLRNRAEYKRHMDPRNEDSDADGYDDGDEVWDGSLTTRPMDADTDDDGVLDGDEDADLDGIDNEDEDDATEHCVDDDDDADHDGIDDEDENDFGTSPTDADSDDDGVVDGDEDADSDGVDNEDVDDDEWDVCTLADEAEEADEVESSGLTTWTVG